MKPYKKAKKWVIDRLDEARAVIGYWHIKIKHAYPPRHAIMLNLGCGVHPLPGYINIDFKKTRGTDFVCNINKLPFSQNSVDGIVSFHVIEHLDRHQLPKSLSHWYSLLKPGGTFVAECPDFDGAVKGYMNGDVKMLDSIYGLQRYRGDLHYFGYNFKRLKDLLESTGFKDIQNKEAQDYHAQNEPCLRVECIK